MAWLFAAGRARLGRHTRQQSLAGDCDVRGCGLCGKLWPRLPASRFRLCGGCLCFGQNCPTLRTLYTYRVARRRFARLYDPTRCRFAGRRWHRTYRRRACRANRRHASLGNLDGADGGYHDALGRVEQHRNNYCGCPCGHSNGAIAKCLA